MRFRSSFLGLSCAVSAYLEEQKVLSEQRALGCFRFLANLVGLKWDCGMEANRTRVIRRSVFAQSFGYGLPLVSVPEVPRLMCLMYLG